METFISSIGPDLCRFSSDRDRVAVVIEFLGKLMGRPPEEREERLAAATLDMALQVYHTYTTVDLRHLVQWHADVWVPQQMRVIEDELLSDDVLGNWQLPSRHVGAEAQGPNCQSEQRRVGASLSHQVLRR
jgi:hypothetical protein